MFIIVHFLVFFFFQVVYLVSCVSLYYSVEDRNSEFLLSFSVELLSIFLLQSVEDRDRRLVP